MLIYIFLYIIYLGFGCQAFQTSSKPFSASIRSSHPCVSTLKNENGYKIIQRSRLEKETLLKYSSEDLGVRIYDAQLWFSHFIDTQLVTISPTSITFLYAAGLLTAFSPCSISLLPLTLAFLGADTSEKNQQRSSDVSNTSESTSKTTSTLQTRTLFFTAGLATTLSILGLVAAFLGNVFTLSLGDWPTLGAALLAIVMGLYLLELIQINFPSLDNYFDSSSGKRSGDQLDQSNTGTLKSNENNSEFSKAFLFGASSALVSSPCSSPVLASLLAVIGTSGNPTLGAIFLFAFSLGRATPVVAAGSLSGTLTRRWTTAEEGGISWINAAFASLLIIWGTYQTLDFGAKAILL